MPLKKLMAKNLAFKIMTIEEFNGLSNFEKLAACN